MFEVEGTSCTATWLLQQNTIKKCLQVEGHLRALLPLGAVLKADDEWAGLRVACSLQYKRRSVAVCLLEAGRDVCGISGVPLGAWKWKRRQLEGQFYAVLGITTSFWWSVHSNNKPRVAAACIARLKGGASEFADKFVHSRFL
jgi:hypothetical protein